MTTKSNNQTNILADVLPLTIGEVLAVCLVTLGGLALDYAGVYEFGAGIPLGAILGAIVTVINYLVLIISLDAAVKKYLDLRGERQMSEEEAEAFAKAHTGAVQKTIARSTVLRTASIVGCLLIAFLTGLFNPIATILPLIAYRPILTVVELIRAKKQPAPNPENYVKYDYTDENEEKESD
jgi:hypothetical protein